MPEVFLSFAPKGMAEPFSFPTNHLTNFEVAHYNLHVPTFNSVEQQPKGVL